MEERNAGADNDDDDPIPPTPRDLLAAKDGSVRSAMYRHLNGFTEDCSTVLFDDVMGALLYRCLPARRCVGQTAARPLVSVLSVLS